MRISIAGYYGFGNAGDEAMGQALASRLTRAGHTVFIQSESPALYHGCAYREMNARQTAEHVDRLIIGGGDLGTGFAWNLIPFALHAGRQVYLAGMEFPHQWTGNGHEKAARLIRAVLESCAQIWPRNSAGYRRLIETYQLANVHQGADPAFLLPVPAVERRDDLALIYLRHTPWSDALERCRLAVLSSLPPGTTVMYVACAGDDEAMMRSLGLECVRPRTPQANLSLAAAARICISFRRLHPLTFAHHVGTPAVAVRDECHHPPEKVAAFCEDAGTEHYGAGQPDQLAVAVRRLWDAAPDVDPTVMQRRAEAMLQAIGT